MPPLLLDEDEGPGSVSLTWCVDEDGTLRHNPSGMQVSPERGVVVDGQSYARMDPRDIDMDSEKALGAGASGVVKVGLHNPTQTRVAVKTVKVDNKQKRELMLHEIKGLIQAAGCPYLVQWYAGFVAKETGIIHIVIEFMDRGSLTDLRRRLGPGNGVPPEHLAPIAGQIIRGLHHLQTRMMLHRDVKPENVLHNATGLVKLTDFGISRDLDSASGVAATFVGTANYMSPERALGKDYSYKSDVWSAGMVVYELATGKFPFSTSHFMDLFECLSNKPEPRLDEGSFPPPLCDFVAQCLTREEDRRADAEMLLAHDLVREIGDEHIAFLAQFLATMPD